MRIYYVFFIILMILTATSWADSDPSILRLTGTGEITVIPDTVEFDLSVETQSGTAAVAAAENAQKMAQVSARLQELLDKTGSFKTSNYQVYPVYQTQQGERQNTLLGYRVSNQISVKTMNLKDFGNILDALMKAGINQVQSLNFTHSESDRLEQEALTKAIRDAHAQASFAADTAGVKIIALQQMELLDSRPGPFYRKNAMMALESSASTPITPGDLTISKQVNMVYIISPKG